MIVQPSLPDHPKYLRLKQMLGPVAMEVLIRLWTYAQELRTSVLGRVDGAYIKSITRYGGSAAKLWQALAIDRLPGKSSWLDVEEDGTVVVHGFAEYNKGLNSSRENGKSGGRPTGKPNDNPPVILPVNPPVTEGLNGTGLNRTGQDRSPSGSNRPGSEEQAIHYFQKEFPVELIREVWRSNELAQKDGVWVTADGPVRDWRRLMLIRLEDRNKKNAPPPGLLPGDQPTWWTDSIPDLRAVLNGAVLMEDEKTAARLREIITLRGGNH